MAPRVKPAARRRETKSEKELSRRDKQGRGKPEPRKPPAARPGRGRRRIDRRGRGRLGRGAQEKVRGWLATPADWARFNAWAKINAQPKKIPEPEPIVRPAKPLSKLRKRMNLLSEPRKAVDPSIHCKLDTSVSRAALQAVASMRTNLLALPNIRLMDYGRVFYQISPTALTYEASPRILALSQPRKILPEECQPPAISECRPPLDQDRLKELAMQKKLLHCPEQLTKEEMEELFTPLGTRRTALKYRITPWVEFLALPSYKTIKERKDEQARIMKKTIIKDGEQRAKEAWVEYKKRRAEEIKEERRMRRLRKKLCEEEKKKEEQRKLEEERKKKGGEEQECDDLEYLAEEPEEKKVREEKSKVKKRERLKRKRRTRDRGDAKGEGEEGELTKEEEEKRRKEKERKERLRKKRKHAWRFAPLPCKEDPFGGVDESTLKYEATPRMTELSKPIIRKNRAIKTHPFVVKKSALSASASGRVQDLAKPPRPRSPVERRPPREKDAYGKPIFKLPPYGKKLPKTKPYKMGECPKEDKEKKKKIRKRPIDPIAYEPTVDPCIYPDLAKKQKKERKRAAKLPSAKRKNKRRGRRREASQMKGPSRVTIAEVEEEEEEEAAEEAEVKIEEE
ncbi:uncharacterized protein LOC100876280 [Megachile rotundata]|uniref:uncharacterized protein LOC100876280 n=1 Tax=Megachile rotundata TaxID=143995 RepID=UPI0006151DA2|nr:PREDICTED: trichohyalin-like [Megachile rotundata]